MRYRHEKISCKEVRCEKMKGKKVYDGVKLSEKLLTLAIAGMLILLAVIIVYSAFS